MTATQDPVSGQSASCADWRRLVESTLGDRPFDTLRSRTPDGSVIEPLYEAASGPAALPRGRAGPWVILQLIDDTDADAANSQALAALTGGATGLQLRFAGGPLAGSGLPATAGALDAALRDVDPATVQLRIDPHPAGPDLARWLGDLVARCGIAPELTRIAFGLGPPAASAGDGGESQDHLVACFKDLSAAGFAGALATLDGRVVHACGGNDAQELAAILASAAWWLRTLDAAGVTADATLAHCDAAIAVDRDQFAGIAKLRALRLLWAWLCELCGAPPARLLIHAETSGRMMTRAEPHTNIVRITLAAFAAAVGGADSITVLPFGRAPGRGDADRLARNTQHLLLAEAHLARIGDPAAGSGAVEALTDQLAERAWDEFRLIEREGGIRASLYGGGFAARLAASRLALREALTNGRDGLVGVTEYVLTGGEPAANAEAMPVAGPLAPVTLEALAGAGR